MTYQFSVHPQMKLSAQAAGVRASLSKNVSPDLYNLTSLLEQWVEQTLELWKSSDSASPIGNFQRLFYRDALFPHDAMFRLRRVEVGTNFFIELVIASIGIAPRLRNKGYFSEVLNKAEAIAGKIGGDLIVECANPSLSSILMRRGYLRWSEYHRCIEPLSFEKSGTWKWSGQKPSFVLGEVIAPAAIAAEIEHLSKHHYQLVGPIIEQVITEAFQTLRMRLRDEVEPAIKDYPLR